MMEDLRRFADNNHLPSWLQITGNCLIWQIPNGEGESITLQFPGDIKEDTFMFNPQSMTVGRAQELGIKLTLDDNYRGQLRKLTTDPSGIRVSADLFWPTRVVLWTTAISANGEVTYQVIDKSTPPEPDLSRPQSMITLPKLTAPVTA